MFYGLTLINFLNLILDSQILAYKRFKYWNTIKYFFKCIYQSTLWI